MSSTKNYTFEASSNYTYNSDEINLSNGKVKPGFTDNEGLTFQQDFTSDTGFSYDSSLTEFSAGKIQQKDQRPANSIVAGTFLTSLNASWGAVSFSDLTATPTGTPSVVSEKAYCPPGNNGFYWEDPLIGALGGDFVLKFEYYPGFTGNPSNITNIIGFEPPSGSLDRVLFAIGSSGGIRLTANGTIYANFGAVSFTAGQKYVIEAICVSDSVSLYVDDVLIGTLLIAGGQGNTATRLVIGAARSAYQRADGYYDNIILYSTASQTISYTVPDYIYLEDKITLPLFTYAMPGNLQAFTAISSTENGAFGYILNSMYWNGSTWLLSDETYSQTNSVTDANSNISTLQAADTLSVMLLTVSSNTQMWIDSLTVTYTGQLYTTSNPKITTLEDVSLQVFTSLAHTLAAAGLDTVKYTLLKGSTEYYWDGADWVESDETYAQTNVIAELNTNASSFTDEETNFFLSAYLHSEDGSTAPELDNILLTYSATTFFVEDGTGREESNSYASVQEFKDYFEKFNITISDSTEDIRAWLMEATLYTDTKYLYDGYKADEDQALEFPRLLFYDNRGKYYSSSTIPQYLKNGVFELAYFIKENGTLTPNVTCTGIKSKKIGPLSVTYDNQENRLTEPFCAKAEMWFSRITKDNAVEVLPV